VDIKDYFDKLEARARIDRYSHLVNLRYAQPLYCAIMGGMITFAFIGVGLGPMAAAAAITILVVVVIMGCADWATEADLRRLRAHVREQLLDHGLLQLLLEHDPYDRLPALRPRLAHDTQSRGSADAGSFKERLERAVETYAQCCRNLGLPVPRWTSAVHLRAAVRLELVELLRPETNSA